MPADQLKATVPGLTEGEKYDFRVKAINAAGPGSPSNNTGPITAKPRNLAPKIDRTNLVQVKIRAGQSFTYDVNVAGEPPPEKKWTLARKPVTPSDRIRSVEGGELIFECVILVDYKDECLSDGHLKNKPQVLTQAVRV